MKKSLILFTLLGAFLSITASPVNLQTARSVAAKFMGTNDLQLATTYQTERSVVAFYVFNTANGFVIVSADDCETPIIGYSHEGRFDPNNLPVQMEDYLQDFVARINYGIENHLEADEHTAKQWELVEATGRLNNHKDTKSVEPLLTEKWHQGCLYNSLCPEMSGPCNHANVGCVAVAMGMIMHYWRYPETGWGSSSYTQEGLTLYADFGNTTYDWDHMPDSLTENSSEAEIEAVATLLYHCGISVRMHYSQNNSIANSSVVPDALERYFSYSRQLHLEKQNEHGNEEWLSMLKNCLDMQRPVYYSGSGSQGGHAFVCDGYDDNNLMHFNWGWGVANGYFALGNMNPIGQNFNNNNTAVFDIIPHYEPCLVTASTYPSTAGTIEGAGEYHVGAQCTLTAMPSENAEFSYWKRNGQIATSDIDYIFEVDGDIDDIVAVFSFLPAKQIEACYAPDANNPNSPYINLSWNHDNTQWKVLKEFACHGEMNAITDGGYIYTINNFYSSNPAFNFGKYSLNGDLVELFSLDAGPFDTDCLAYDGNYFYCKRTTSVGRSIFCIDMANKTIIDSISVNYSINIGNCTYDPENDGFWMINTVAFQACKLVLIGRNGEVLFNGPTLSNFTRGLGYVSAIDGSSHLLILLDGGKVYDYDIASNTLKDRPLLNLEGYVYGASVGKYEGKDAMFAVVDSTVYIYEIKSLLTEIIGYRIYRAGIGGDTVMIADEVAGSSYTDTTWENALAGSYRYGISSVFANGNESEIVWSDYIEKNDHGIGESQDYPTAPSVRKVLEEGRIVIIKDGKRYTSTGQQLN